MNDDSAAYLVIAIILAIGALIYCIPSIVAFRRRHPNRWLILAINVFLGGTGFVWVCCLIWAFHKIHNPVESNNGQTSGGESGLNLFANDVKTVRIADNKYDSIKYDASHSDYLAQLEQLATLKDRGVLSEEEFKAQKEKLLS